MNFRLFCSNLHFYENAKRKQATTKDGTYRWAIVYPKAFKGEKAIPREIKEHSTFSMLYNNIYRVDNYLTVALYRETLYIYIYIYIYII